MPKIYQKPDQLREPESDSRRHTSLGEQTQKRGMMLVVMAILAIIVVIMLYRMARGEESQAAVTQPETSDIVSLAA